MSSRISPTSQWHDCVVYLCHSCFLAAQDVYPTGLVGDEGLVGLAVNGHVPYGPHLCDDPSGLDDGYKLACGCNGEVDKLHLNEIIDAAENNL